MVNSVVLEIPIRKIDNKSTVFTTNTVILDAPIIKEREYDYDDLDGVVKDYDVQFELSIHVTAATLRKIIKNNSKYPI